MTFDDTVALSFVSFVKHVNLGGASSKFLHDQATQCQISLLGSGMVRVTKPNGIFYVAAGCIESAEAAETMQNAENDLKMAEMAEMTPSEAVKAHKTPKSGKLAASTAHMTRADEILAELTGK